MAEVAQSCGIPTIRTDGNAIYPRGSRVMRWLETCAAWCCGGWKIGEPRFSHISNEGSRLLREAVAEPADKEKFFRILIDFLWKNRDDKVLVNTWLVHFYDNVLRSYIKACPTLNDELENLAEFIKRCSASGDCSTMTLAQFAGQSVGSDCINLSTLHSSKGREFSVVIMFGMDDERIPRRGANARETIEARRLFYVGFTRAKAEVHIISTRYRASRFVTEIQSRLSE